MKTKGIHHISSVAGHAQRSIDFNAGVLGYRLVKQTLNYDDKEMYHLYFGNREANSGLITTFPMNNSACGKVGGGQVAASIYAIRPDSINFWKNRLQSFGIDTTENIRFNQKRLVFKDPEGLTMELVEQDKGPLNTWEFNGVKGQDTITGIESALIYSRNPEKTLNLFTEVLGYSLADEDNDHYLLKVHDELGGFLELAKKPSDRGLNGIGTVHHIAFAVGDNEIDNWKIKLEENAYRPTEVKDRKYFRSIYFREKGGLLIELATKSPGMTVDEKLGDLGSSLIIPEDFKNENHDDLMPLFVREVKELSGYGYRDRYEYEILQAKHEIMNKIKEIKLKENLSEADKNKLEALKKQYLNKGES